MKVHFLKTFLFYLSPFLWALFWVMSGLMPERLFQSFHQSLPLVLIVIFYFALFSPNRLNVLCVFLLGLLADLLSSGIMGLNAFIFVGMFFMANMFQSYIQEISFKQLWGIFCGLMLITDIIWAWLARLAIGVWVSPSFWFVQYVFT